MKNHREWYHNNLPKKGLRSHMVNKGSNTVNIISLLWKQGKHKGWNSLSRYKIVESDTLLWSSSSLSTACTAVLSASSLKHWMQMWSSAIKIKTHTKCLCVHITDELQFTSSYILSHQHCATKAGSHHSFCRSLDHDHLLVWIIQDDRWWHPDCFAGRLSVICMHDWTQKQSLLRISKDSKNMRIVETTNTTVSYVG